VATLLIRIVQPWLVAGERKFSVPWGECMSSESITSQALWRSSRVYHETARTALLVVGSLLFLTVFSKLIRALYKTLGPHTALEASVPIIVAVGVALIFARDGYDKFSPLLRIALRSSCLGLFVYLLVEPPSVTLTSPAYAGDAQYIDVVYYFAVAFAAISVFSPSFVLPVAVFIFSTRYLNEEISGLRTSTLDIRYMVDMALYLSVFAIGVTRLGPKLFSGLNLRAKQEQITFIAFGLHLGNYFWSGIAKLQIGPHIWSWALENQTQNLIPYSLDKGTLPFGQSPWLAQHAYDVMQATVLPMNLAVAGFQLFALVCVLRLSWLKIATVFYDIFHISIYVFGGLFFWPWIWNNFTIILAANRVSTISSQAKIACILTILAGNPIVKLYDFARLAWFDVADARQIYFEAITDTGERARVPASFFLTHSFGVSLGYMDTEPHPGHYGATSWNAAKPYHRQLTSGTCPQPPTDKEIKGESDEDRKARLDKIQRFLRAHHKKMLAREEKFGKFHYYYRVHHHPSNPYLFADFSDLEIKDVLAYELVVESACYQLRDGHLVKKVVGKTVDRFNVR
jgi:hypothetical protein